MVSLMAKTTLPRRIQNLPLLVCFLLLTGSHLPAWGQVESRWSGIGWIVSGPGQGATVQLVVEIRDGRVRTRSGPELDAPFAQGVQTITTGEETWQLEPQGQTLSITLHRRDQIIRYQLSPDPVSNPSPEPPPPSAPLIRQMLPNSGANSRPLLRR
jgi:hypothetical protein